MKNFNLSVLSLLAFLFASVNVMAKNFAEYASLPAATITVYTASGYPTTPVDGWDHVTGKTITSAVSTAGNGGYVVLSPGKWVVDYRDQVSISTTVNILGAGKNETFILGNPNTYNNSTDGITKSSGAASKYKNVVAIGGTSTGSVIEIRDLTIDGCECGNGRADFDVIRMNGNPTATTVNMYNCNVHGKNSKTMIQVGSGSNICNFNAYGCYLDKNGGSNFYANVDVVSGSSFKAYDTYFEGFTEGNAEFDLSVTCYYEYNVTGYYNADKKEQPRKFYASIQSVINWYDEHKSLQAMLPALNAQDASNAGTILEVMVDDLTDCNTTFCGGTLADKLVLAGEFLRVMDACESTLVGVYGLPAFTTMRNKVADVVANGLPTCPAPVSVRVKPGETATLNNKAGYETIILENGSKATIPANKKITAEKFVMNIKAGESAQLEIGDAAGLNAAETEVVITLADGKLDNSQYYSIAVPFPVALSSLKLRNSEMEVVGENNGNYRIYRYDGAQRANTGNGWVRIEDANTVLVPGEAYLMAFGYDLYNQVVLTKTEGKLNNKAELAPVAYASANATDANWNSLANNGLANTGIEIGKMVEKKFLGWVISSTWTPTATAKISVLKNVDGVNKYDLVTANSATLTPGAPFFWQKSDDTFKWAAANGSVVLVQGREAEESNEICLQIKKTADDFIDQMFVSASDDAINEYEIGKDVAKMIINSGKVASIYTEAYGTKLAAFDARFVDDMAVVPFVISAPKAENYTLHMPTATELSVLLTLNGEVVANLSETDYTLAANAGNNNGYALVIARAKGNAPTAIINNTKAAKAVKMMNNGHLFIYTGERAYDAQGRIVK